MVRHHFLLVSNKYKVDKIMQNYYSGINKRICNQVKIEEDVILYIMNTLKFIKPSFIADTEKRI